MTHMQTDEDVKAWVVFSGKADVLWLRVLKPGFRHCYLLMNDGKKWISVDPMLNHMDVTIHHHISPEFDLPSWAESQGQTVIQAPVNRKRMRPAPFSVLSCVEVVKRILGIHIQSILTPWQLYQYLMKGQF